MNLPRIKARTVAGAGIFILSQQVLLMLYLKPELSDNDLFKVLAQAIVLQGLVGLAMAFWFTDKDRNHPDQVEVTNGPSDPVPVDEHPRSNTGFPYTIKGDE